MINVPIQLAERKNDKGAVEYSVVLSLTMDINARTMIRSTIHYQITAFNASQKNEYASKYIPSLRKAIEEFDILRTKLNCFTLANDAL